MQKVCYKCRKQQPIAHFAKSNKRKDGHASACKQCHAVYHRNWYKRHNKMRRAQIAERKRQQRQLNVDFVRTVKIACLVCGESAYECLDFHHLTSATKEHTVANLVYKGANLEIIKAEIAKCVVLCANCHRRYHAGTLVFPLNSNR